LSKRPSKESQSKPVMQFKRAKNVRDIFRYTNVNKICISRQKILPFKIKENHGRVKETHEKVHVPKFSHSEIII